VLGAEGEYRATLASGMPKGAVQFVLLDGSKELIAERLARGSMSL
jgi:gluconokinase